MYFFHNFKHYVQTKTGKRKKNRENIDEDDEDDEDNEDILAGEGCLTEGI
jgi:hypothetical protein